MLTSTIGKKMRKVITLKTFSPAHKKDDIKDYKLKLKEIQDKLNYDKEAKIQRRREIEDALKQVMWAVTV
jgi:hypothetical protein